jgi:hypothetical protein
LDKDNISDLSVPEEIFAPNNTKMGEKQLGYFSISGEIITW